MLLVPQGVEQAALSLRLKETGQTPQVDWTGSGARRSFIKAESIGSRGPGQPPRRQDIDAAGSPERFHIKGRPPLDNVGP
ncbi:MAG: hypothetical protein ACXVYB_06125, partial [Arthrobacter sp.]